MITAPWTSLKDFVNSRQLSIQWIDANGNYYLQAFDSTFGLQCTLNKSLNLEDVADFEENYKSAGNVKLEKPLDIGSLPDPQPFAMPTFRTKRSANSDIVVIQPGESADIDFELPEERYVHGGKILAFNNQIGDYFTGEIVDTNSLIPAPYRAALCENWPMVAQYIVKEWMDFTGNHEINTYPLNAKVTQGLVLRITYHAADTGEARQVGVNYYLTKKL